MNITTRLTPACSRVKVVVCIAHSTCTCEEALNTVRQVIKCNITLTFICRSIDKVTRHTIQTSLAIQAFCAKEHYHHAQGTVFACKIYPGKLIKQI